MVKCIREASDAHLQEVQPPETLVWHLTACSNSCLMRRQLVLGHCASWQRLTWSSRPMVRCSCAARLARSSSLSRSVVSLILRACACGTICMESRRFTDLVFRDKQINSTL